MCLSDCVDLLYIAEGKSSLNKTFINALFTVIDWVAFFTLGTIALVAVQGIWSDFSNTKTSLSWSSEAISSHPTITMCFGPNHVNDDKMFDIQTEMNISYTINSKQSMVLNEKDNTSPEFGDEIIQLERMSRCYKLSTNASPTKREERSIKIEITPHLEGILNRLPMKIFFFLTSAENSFGVEQDIFIEGNPYETQVSLQHQMKTILKPKKIEYLKEMRGGCEDSGFWNVVESTFVSDIKRKCPIPCSTFKLPSGTLEDCLKLGVPMTEVGCSFNVLYEVITKVLKNGFAPCTKMEYEGKEMEELKIDGTTTIISKRTDGSELIILPPNFDEKITVIFSYKFETPETTDVFSEYIIVDTMTMIGSIGGMLGLYVGFSFFDFAMQILDWILTLVVRISKSSIFKEAKNMKEENKQQKKNKVALKPKNAA